MTALSSNINFLHPSILHPLHPSVHLCLHPCLSISSRTAAVTHSLPFSLLSPLFSVSAAICVTFTTPTWWRFENHTDVRLFPRGVIISCVISPLSLLLSHLVSVVSLDIVASHDPSVPPPPTNTAGQTSPTKALISVEKSFLAEKAKGQGSARVLQYSSAVWSWTRSHYLARGLFI